MTGSIDPLREQFDAFKALPRDQPIQMLNLVRLNALAAYPDGHPDHGKGLTGLDAYRAYGRTTAHIFKRVGGRQIWVGKPEGVVTGPSDEHWDLAFIAEYPNAAAARCANRGSDRCGRANAHKSALPDAMIAFKWSGSVIFPTAIVAMPTSLRIRSANGV